MKQIILKIKIWYFTAKLKSAYLEYINDDADCGGTLFNYITGRRDLVNYYIEKLRKLDPACTLKPLE